MQSTTRFGTWCALTLTAAGLLVMPAAQAQQQSPAGPSVITPSPHDADEYSRQKARRGRRRRQKSVRDQGQLRSAIGSRRRSPKRNVSRSEAGDAMEKAVTDQGLSVEEYTTILERGAEGSRRARQAPSANQVSSLTWRVFAAVGDYPRRERSPNRSLSECVRQLYGFRGVSAACPHPHPTLMFRTSWRSCAVWPVFGAWLP